MKEDKFGLGLVPPNTKGTKNAPNAPEVKNPRDSVPLISLHGNLRFVNDCWEHFWDQQMGKPRSGRTEPVFKETPMSQLIGTLIRVFGGSAITAFVFTVLFNPLFWTLGTQFLIAALPTMAVSILSGWILTTGGARKILTTIVHCCIHAIFVKDRDGDKKGTSMNVWLADWLTALFGLQCRALYIIDHVLKHHEPDVLATLSDPDAQTMVRLLGFKPGQPKEFYQRKLAMALFSPRVHWEFLKARFGFIFKVAKPPTDLSTDFPPRLKRELDALFADPGVHKRRRNLAIALQTGILSAVAAMAVASGSWVPVAVFGLAWVFPLTLLYTQSAILQFVTEHGWLRVRKLGEPYKVYLQRIIHNRFVGSAWPQPTGCWWRTAWAHLKWWSRFFVIDLPVRHFVLVGTLCVHGSHHKNQGETDWANEFYVAQRRVEAGEPMTEFWSLLEAFDSIATTLSELPPLPEPASSPSDGVFVETIRGM